MDPEVADHYSTQKLKTATKTEFMNEIPPAKKSINSRRFTRREIFNILKNCENTAPGFDDITNI